MNYLLAMLVKVLIIMPMDSKLIMARFDQMDRVMPYYLK